MDIPVSRLTFPFAQCAPWIELEVIKRDILRRNVIGRGVTCFESAPGSARIDELDTFMDNLDAALRWLADGGARVIPNAFLARADRIRFGISE